MLVKFYGGKKVRATSNGAGVVQLIKKCQCSHLARSPLKHRRGNFVVKTGHKKKTGSKQEIGFHKKSIKLSSHELGLSQL